MKRRRKEEGVVCGDTDHGAGNSCVRCSRSSWIQRELTQISEEHNDPNNLLTPRVMDIIVEEQGAFYI